jgi:nucleotide-binding universal stress UspA family protein
MKSILVHIDASPRSAVRLALAQALARQHGASLGALYGVVPAVLANPWTAGDGMVVAASMLVDLEHEQRERARAMVGQAAAQGAVSWIDGGASPYRALWQHALYADLLVLGQDDAADGLTGALPPGLVPTLVAEAGRPTLVLPAAGDFESRPGRVLIAWKPTREAARAVAAALPWLLGAAAIDIATRPEGDADDIDHAAALQHWLRQQGVTAPVHGHVPGEGDIGERLLGLAADTGAGLLVMGCYGHSRTREWVLGGASRSVLHTMTLPVLMVH